MNQFLVKLVQRLDQFLVQFKPETGSKIEPETDSNEPV